MDDSIPGQATITCDDNVTDMGIMFYNCPNLKDAKIKNPPSWFNGAGLSESQYTIIS